MIYKEKHETRCDYVTVMLPCGSKVKKDLARRKINMTAEYITNIIDKVAGLLQVDHKAVAIWASDHQFIQPPLT